MADADELSKVRADGGGDGDASLKEEVAALRKALRVTRGVSWVLFSLLGMGAVVMGLEVFVVGQEAGRHVDRDVTVAERIEAEKRSGAEEKGGGGAGTKGEGQEGKEQEVLRVRGLVVVDDAGRERMMLATGTNGLPVLLMRDDDGRPRMTLALGEGGVPALILSDDQRRVRGTLALGEEGRGRLAYVRGDGAVAMELADVGHNGQAGSVLRLFGGGSGGGEGGGGEGEGGGGAVRIGAGPGGTGMRLFDSEGLSRGFLELTEQGLPRLEFRDGLGHPFYFAP